MPSGWRQLIPDNIIRIAKVQSNQFVNSVLGQFYCIRRRLAGVVDHREINKGNPKTTVAFRRHHRKKNTVIRRVFYWLRLQAVGFHAPVFCDFLFERKNLSPSLSVALPFGLVGGAYLGRRAVHNDSSALDPQAAGRYVGD